MKQEAEQLGYSKIEIIGTEIEGEVIAPYLIR